MDSHRACSLAETGGEWTSLPGGIGLNEYRRLNVSFTEYPGNTIADLAFLEGQWWVYKAVDAQGMGAIRIVVEGEKADTGTVDDRAS